MFKKIIYISFLIFFATSCADTFNSVKRGITGQKQGTTDEFLIEKKDPLILPPDYENLPTPDESIAASEEISVFEENLEIYVEVEENSSSSTDSVENSILKRIQSQ